MVKVSEVEKAKRPPAYLFANPLPAILALDRVFDDGVAGGPAVDEGDDVEGDADADEVEDFVDEGARRGMRRRRRRMSEGLVN